ncbi:hypothetical protein NKH43_19160 [Mesorhizobium sp. M1163]
MSDTAPRLTYAEHLKVSGSDMFAHACGMGLEGIVSKRADAPYGSGVQTSWVKVKCMKSDTFPIVAFVEKLGAGLRRIASLYIGRRQDEAVSVLPGSIFANRDLASATRRCAARILLHNARLMPTPQPSSIISFARSRERSARLSRCRALASSISKSSIIPNPLRSLRFVNRLLSPLVPAVRERAAQRSMWRAQFWSESGRAGGLEVATNETPAQFNPPHVFQSCGDRSSPSGLRPRPQFVACCTARDSRPAFLQCVEARARSGGFAAWHWQLPMSKYRLLSHGPGVP